MSERLHGYALAAALRREADDIAREDRAELVRAAANEIEALIVENRRLLDAVAEACRSVAVDHGRGGGR